MIKIFLYPIILAILVFCVSLSYFLFALGPVARGSSIKNFEVESGQSLEKISTDLEAAGLIRSENVFKIFAILSGQAHLLKPGSFVLDSASGTPAILGRLVKGAREEITVAIIEGMTLRDIEEKLSAANILPLKAISQFNFDALKKDYEFLGLTKGLEGYLFPDTYNFFKNSGTELVVRKFLDNFNKKAWPVLKACLGSGGKCQGLTKDQLITLASLLEKEVPGVEDKKIVAGILLERLALGIPLQVDATISYAKCFGTFVFCDNPAIKREDLKWQSLYNTYLYPGLPPGPISNPGLASITAAIKPERSDYMYYLSDPKTKKTIYSRTLDEHNDNRVKYLGL